MKRHIAVAVAALFFIISSASVFASPAYDHSLGDDIMSFHWRLDSDKNLIHVKVTGKTKSWVSVGFNPTRRMKDADFVMGYVKNGKVKATDHFGVDIFMHKKDDVLGGADNISDLSGKEEGGKTEISFSIPLNSGDSKDSVIHPDKETTILLAHAAGRDTFRTKHVYRSIYSVNLSTGAFKKIK